MQRTVTLRSSLIFASSAGSPLKCASAKPAWIGVGKLDVFHDEDVAYAERLRAAGVPCELVTVPGMYHGADGIVANAASMQNFHASMIDFLRCHLTAASDVI